MKKVAIGNILKSLGAEKAKLKNGHNGYSGFFFYGDIVVYIAKDNNCERFLIRSALNYKDYVGGPNHFLDYTSNKEELKNRFSEALIQIKREEERREERRCQK